MPETRVAIAGCGVISAVGGGVESLRTALRANTSSLRPASRFSGPRFQSNVVGTALAEAATSDDPAQLLAATALNEAQATAQPTLAKLPPARIGLVLSTTKANIEALERLTDGRPCSADARRHLQPDLLAADLAAAVGAAGPVQTLSVACVSGLIALMQGARLIQRGAADAVFVVGVDHLSAFVVAGFSALKALDPAGCRPFDRDRCGLSPGEAGAAIVLARADLAPPGAIQLRGWGSSNDANHMTGPSRDGSGLAQAIRSALNSAKLASADIDYINVHAPARPTTTPWNPPRCAPFSRMLAHPPADSKAWWATRSAPAGVLETIACTLAMREQLLPGTARLSHPADGVPASLLSAPRPAGRLRHILKLNTGFGGANGALILEQP